MTQSTSVIVPRRRGEWLLPGSKSGDQLAPGRTHETGVDDVLVITEDTRKARGDGLATGLTLDATDRLRCRGSAEIDPIHTTHWRADLVGNTAPIQHMRPSVTVVREDR